jgi:hypothetical protein
VTNSTALLTPSAELDVLRAAHNLLARLLAGTESICASQRGQSQDERRPDTHLNYMIDIALTTEFALVAGGAP